MEINKAKEFSKADVVNLPNEPVVVTILEAQGNKLLTKRFSRDGCRNFDHARYFKPSEVEISTPEDLANLLEHLQHEPGKMIIAGRVRRDLLGDTPIRRLLHPRDDCEPTLEDVPTRLLHFDIDDLALPPGLTWSDPEAVARWAWTQLGKRLPALEGVTVCWQASASAGTPKAANIAKLHFWALADRPLSSQARRHVYECAGSDVQLASAAQPQYTAAPIFDGVEDPLEGKPRTGLLRGWHTTVPTTALDLPDHAPTRHARSAKDRAPTQPTVSPGPARTSARGRSFLASACKKILAAEQPNNEIFRQAFRVGGHVATGEIAEEDARSALEEAGRAIGHDRYLEAIDNGLRAGVHKPIVPRDARHAPLAPYHPAGTLDRDTAVARYTETISNWWQMATDWIPQEKAGNRCDPPPRVLVRGAQGVGKTSTLVGRAGKPGLLHESKGIITLMLVPDHAKVDEVIADYRDNAPLGAPPIRAILGRSRRDPKARDYKMCRALGLAQSVALLGLSARSALCPRCPHAAACGYLRQEAELKELAAARDGLVLVAPHDYGFLPLPGQIEPDLLIFDERPRDLGVEETTVTLDELRDEWRRHRKLEAVVGLARALKFANPDDGQLSWNLLRECGVTRTTLEAAIGQLGNFCRDRVSDHLRRHLENHQDFLGPGDTTSPDRFSRQVSREKLSVSLRLKKLFECLLMEVDSGREILTGVTWHEKTEGRDQRSPWLRAVRLKPMPNGAGRPLLCLDGTADPEMCKVLFGGALVCHHYPVERRAHVTQVTGCNFSKRRLLNRLDCLAEENPRTEDIGKQNQKLFQRVLAIIDRIDGAAVFASKEIIKALGLSGSPRAGHFGALRGRNKWSHYHSVIVIGREQPAPEAVEKIARAYAAASGNGFLSRDYTKETRGIRTRGGCEPLEVSCHPDPWGDRILQQIREAEIIQAIDRIRLIHNDDPKKVYLLSPVVVDVTVDRVMKWPEFYRGGSRIERAIAAHRVLLLSPRDCARYMPDIWTNHQNAARDLAAMKKSGLRDTDAHAGPGASGPCRVEFRVRPKHGRRSRAKKALVFAERGQVRDVLEAVVGPVEELKIEAEGHDGRG